MVEKVTDVLKEGRLCFESLSGKYEEKMKEGVSTGIIKRAHPKSGDVFKLVAIHEFLDEAKSFVVLLLLLQPITVRSLPIMKEADFFVPKGSSNHIKSR